MGEGALCLGMFAIAAVLHGATGTGFPIVTTAALMLLLPLKSSIVLLLLPTLVVNLLSIGGEGRLLAVPRGSAALAVASVAGSLLGMRLLFVVDPAWLQLALAMAVGFQLLRARAAPTPRAPGLTPGRSIAFGFAAGLLGGPTNAMSPVLMTYLLAAVRDKHAVARAANLCFLLGKVSQAAALLWAGERLLDPGLLLFALPASGLAAVFLRYGVALRERMSARLFRRINLTLQGLLAAALLARSVPAALRMLGIGA